MNRLRVGIAGYGVVGRRRHECVGHHPGLKVVAVSEVLFNEGVDVVPDVACFNDFREIFSQDLDALVVCLPNDVAPVATTMGLEHGLHVFCEKPPGRTVEDVVRVRDAEADRPHLVLKYGFNHRYHESVKEAKDLIDSGKYGQVVNLRGVYGKSRMIPFSGGWRVDRSASGGGILLDQGIHLLDLIMYFAGSFDDVRSFVSNDFWQHDVEDNAWALLRNTATGCVAMLHSTATQWRHKFRLEIALDKALIELTGILSGSKSYGEEKLTLVEQHDGSMHGTFEEYTKRYLHDASWQEEVDEFADAIISGTEIKSGSSADALAVMELINRIYCADEAWRSRFDIRCSQSG
jgi:predicted dehydrogenase